MCTTSTCTSASTATLISPTVVHLQESMRVPQRHWLLQEVRKDQKNIRNEKGANKKHNTFLSTHIEIKHIKHSAGTRKHCIFGHLGLAFIWSCFGFCLFYMFLLFYVISAPVTAEKTAY